MTADYNPTEAQRLIAEAREDDATMVRGPWLGEEMIPTSDEDCQAIARTRNNLPAIADQIEAAGKEVERLRLLVDAGMETYAELESEHGLLRTENAIPERERGSARTERDSLRAEVESLKCDVDLEVAEVDLAKSERDSLRKQVEAAQAKCACTYEAGDTDCARHPTCPDCGMRLDGTEVVHALAAAQRTIDSGNEAFRQARERWHEHWKSLTADSAQTELRALKAEADLAAAQQRIAELETVVARGTRFDENAANMYIALHAICPVYRAAVAYVDGMRRVAREAATGERGRLVDRISVARAALTPEILAALERAGLECK